MQKRAIQSSVLGEGTPAQLMVLQAVGVVRLVTEEVMVGAQSTVQGSRQSSRTGHCIFRW